MASIVTDRWTGTKGHQSAEFPGDWDEDAMRLRELRCDRDIEPIYSTRFIATVWDWAMVTLGREAKNMTIVQIVERWFDEA